MTYFLITHGEDGINVQELSESGLREHIEPDSDGNYYHGGPLNFLKKVPSIDSGCFEGEDESAAILIKGEIIVPKVVKVSVKYEL